MHTLRQKRGKKNISWFCSICIQKYLPTVKDLSELRMKIQIKVSTEFILDAQTYSGDGGEKKSPENLIFEILQLQTRNKTNFQN